MLVDIVLGSKAVWRVLSVLAEAPGQGITKEEIKKTTKLGGNSIFESIKILLKSDMVASGKAGKKTFYRMNMSNKYSRLVSEIIQNERRDLNNMNLKIVTILREYVRQIYDSMDIAAVYVFGSMVKNSYREDSDIDIAIITEKDISAKDRIALEKIGEGIEKRFGREMQPHFFTEKEFRKSEGGIAEQVKRDGITLI
ncbi:MAG: nucleotidyltransferase domain-containing protein [Candidatus Aenigmatarchaeota archaeon]